MEREKLVSLMNDIYTASEAAEYLNISTQRLHQLVKDGSILPIKSNKAITLFYKEDLDERKIQNIYENNYTGTKNLLNIDVRHIRDAIFYYTIQQYFNNNDKRTSEFIDQIKKTHNFDFHSGLKVNLPLVSTLLNINEKEFYNQYLVVKKSFQSLTDDVIILEKGSELYSKLLSGINEAPPFLFLKGDVHLLNEKSVCVVGSRNATPEAMDKTAQLVKSLVKRNIVINAGLAKGIDTSAHTSALDCGGKTIAVIGTPINQYYPKENKGLQMRIEKEGLVVSQFPPCNKVNRWNFPTRNGVMSGIGIATIIMAASETSGALKQADYALKQNRSVLIPQSAVDSSTIKWPKKYIARGAIPFKKLKDVLLTLNKNTLLKDVFNNVDLEEISNVDMD